MANILKGFENIIKQIKSSATQQSAPQSNPINNPAANTNNTAATTNTLNTQTASIFNENPFEQQNDENTTKKDRSTSKASYDEYIAQLKSLGLKTTGLGEGEANFAEYGAALSEELKNEITKSLDDPNAKAIQDKLIAAYQQKGRNELHTSEFKDIARQLGYEVSSEYVGTTYIVDNKFDGHYDTDVTDGAIEVITIVDPSTGAEIKIADSNGNGAIEIEEVMMNEILEGISANIDTSYFGSVNISAGGSGTGGDGVNHLVEATQEAIEEELALIESEEETEEAEDAKNKEKAENKKSTTTTETTKENKEDKDLVKVSQQRYNEIEDKIIEKYLEKELPEYNEKMKEGTLSREEQKEVDAIIKNAKNYVKQHFDIK